MFISREYTIASTGPTAATRIAEQLSSATPDGPRAAFAVCRRIYDLRLALALLQQGVTELAATNVKDLEALGLSARLEPAGVGMSLGPARP